MLNRLYIVIGTLLIVIIGAAFIVPRFIDWSNRRVQMEALASEALGRPVTISGPIEFTLLPQPHLKFSGVTVGDEQAPIASAQSVTADFSLMDFLRDRFAVTRLSVSEPTVKLTVDKAGQLVVPISLPQSVEASNVSIADASIANATFELHDQRSGRDWRLTGFSGSVIVSALRGPFQLAGTGTYAGQSYQLRVTTSPLNPQGMLQVASFVRPVSDDYSFNLEGMLQTGAAPEFKGKIHFQMRPPPAAEDAQGVRGNLVLDSDLTATAGKLLLPNYVLVPDENRSATRLTGAAVVELGAAPKFDVVASGGVVGLPPRDARSAKGPQPYELVQLLTELPPPLVPPMAGRIGVDIAEFDMRAFSVRNVRLDATTDGKGWAISNLSGKLAGDSALSLKGRVEPVAGTSEFTGRLRVDTERLDALAQMWRKPVEDNPLFNVPGTISADLTLKDGALNVQKGRFVLDGVDNGFSGKVVGGGVINVQADLGALSPLQSRMLTAFLPPISPSGTFGASFHQGSFELTAQSAALDGLVGQELAARGEWGKNGIDFTELSARDLGGAAFTLSGRLGGTLAEPVATAKGRIIFHEQAKNGILPLLYERFGTAPQIARAVERALPLNAQIGLEPLNAKGEQDLMLDGRAGGAELALRAKFSQGLGKALQTPFGLRLELSNNDPAALVGLTGFEVGLPQNGRAKLTAVMQGTLANSFEAQLTLDTNEDKLQYTGSLILSDPSTPKGRGQLEFDLPDPAAWGAALGAAELYAPPLKGVGQFAFSGAASQTLSALQIDAGGASVTGNMARSGDGGTPLVTGALSIDAASLRDAAEWLGGGAALLNGADGVWPDGPFAVDPNKRVTRGRVSVSIGSVALGGSAQLTDVGFEASWDDKQTRIGSGQAKLGGGTVSFGLSYCCSGTQGSRQIQGRLGVNEVPVDAVAPQPSSRWVSAKLTGSLLFNATGGSIAEMFAKAAGSGSFTAHDLTVAGMAPGAFVKVASTEGILDLDAKALADLAAKALVAGPFKAPQMSGVLQLAGGKLAASNLAAQGEGARLFGGLELDLTNLGLDGTWEMSPLNARGASGLVNASTALITARLGGTLFKPERTLDLQTMADAIKVRALELEVDRLQKQKAEKEARDRAAAAERARLMALDAKRQAEEAAAKAEAQRKADQEAAAKAAAALVEAEQNAQQQAAKHDVDPAGKMPSYDDMRRMFGLSPNPVVPVPARPNPPINLVPDNGPIDLTQGQ